MREAAVAVAAHIERIDAVQWRVIGVHGDAQLHRINLDVDCARRRDSENEAKHVQPKDGAAAGEVTPRFAARAVAARVRFEGAAQAEFTTAARGGRVERLVGMGRWGGHAEFIWECARERKSTGCPHANLEGGKGGGGGKIYL